MVQPRCSRVTRTDKTSTNIEITNIGINFQCKTRIVFQERKIRQQYKYKITLQAKEAWKFIFNEAHTQLWKHKIL